MSKRKLRIESLELRRMFACTNDVFVELDFNDGILHIDGDQLSATPDDIKLLANPIPNSIRKDVVVQCKIPGGSYVNVPIATSDGTTLQTDEVNGIRVDLGEANDRLDLRTVRTSNGYAMATTPTQRNSTEPVHIYGRGGADVIHGSEFADCIKAGEPGSGPSDTDTVYGYNGADFIEGKAGADNLYGGDMDDIIYGFWSGGSDWDSSDGNDTIVGGNGNDDLRGQFGDDFIQSDGNQTLQDNDFLRGGPGNDTYKLGYGGYGGSLTEIDVIEEFTGNGTDSIVFDWTIQPGGITINLSTFNQNQRVNSVGQAWQYLVKITGDADSIENVTGTASGDNITGNNVANVIDGKGGTDTGVGLGGFDTQFSVENWTQ